MAKEVDIKIVKVSSSPRELVRGKFQKGGIFFNQVNRVKIPKDTQMNKVFRKHLESVLKKAKLASDYAPGDLAWTNTTTEVPGFISRTQFPKIINVDFELVVN